MSLTLIPTPSFSAAPTVERTAGEERSLPAAGVSRKGVSTSEPVLPGEFGKLFYGLVLADAALTAATSPGATTASSAPTSPALPSLPVDAANPDDMLVGSDVLPCLAVGIDPGPVASQPLLSGRPSGPTGRDGPPDAEPAHAPANAHGQVIGWIERQGQDQQSAASVNGQHLIRADDTPGLPPDLVADSRADVDRPKEADADSVATRPVLQAGAGLAPAPAASGVQTILRDPERPALPHWPTPPLTQAKLEQLQPTTGMGHPVRQAGSAPAGPSLILTIPAGSQHDGATETTQAAVMPVTPTGPRDRTPKPGLAQGPEVPDRLAPHLQDSGTRRPNAPGLGTGILPDQALQPVTRVPVPPAPPPAAENRDPTAGFEVQNRALPIRAPDRPDSIRPRIAPGLASSLPVAGQTVAARLRANSVIIASQQKSSPQPTGILPLPPKIRLVTVAEPRQTVGQEVGEIGRHTQFGFGTGDIQPQQWNTSQGLLSDAASRPAVTASSDHPGRAQASHVAAQLARAVQSQQSGTTDITLNPKELGHVKLSLQAVDGAMFVAIAAERPETADLMRRHIDSLAQEFRALGFQDVSFSFSGRQAGGNAGHSSDPNFGTGPNPDQRQPSQDHHDTGGDQPADRFIPRRAASQTGGSGLDLRL